MYIEETRAFFWVIGQPDDDVKRYYDILRPWQINDLTFGFGWLCRPSKLTRSFQGSRIRLRARNARLWRERQAHPRIVEDGIRMLYLYGAFEEAGLPEINDGLRFVSSEPYKTLVDNYLILTELDAILYEQKSHQYGVACEEERLRVKAAASSLANQLRAAKQDMLHFDELNPLVRQSV